MRSGEVMTKFTNICELSAKADAQLAKIGSKTPRVYVDFQ